MSGAGAQPGDLLRLGALEAQVMDVLWDHGPATIREVIDHLSSEPAYTTIATVLTNLDRKHLVTITRQNHSTRYSARMSRHEHAAQLMEQVLQTSRDRAASILQFVDSMPENDLDLLRDYLKRRDRGNPS
ncbi:BlaI/MecI/CopY family transcriptional regulator [Rhodococcus opacus]|uniref:BlaI/MecI/CopY family transcriptional regulator n=1 Tax=Rhodococcus opacus TaxID=37919 RepID=UPI002235955B|nr:BlaI/MecI/CopY family transcriptional regulator [Rhodococcus opacus]UZG60196.1 BlaI/MecI/CopY family transcriptional regulator [Rhodococcus opacus]